MAEKFWSKVSKAHWNILENGKFGEWEILYNPDFNCTEFGTIKNVAGSNNFVLSVKTWIERTNALGNFFYFIVMRKAGWGEALVSFSEPPHSLTS